jgi:hypothetical protein
MFEALAREVAHDSTAVNEADALLVAHSSTLRANAVSRMSTLKVTRSTIFVDVEDSSVRGRDYSDGEEGVDMST